MDHHDAENDLEHASDIAPADGGPMGNFPAIRPVSVLPAAGSMLGPVAGLAPPSVRVE
jgi:hypothetical protein